MLLVGLILLERKKMKNSTSNSIHSLLNPKSILIVGASEKQGSSARNIIENLLNNGYKGEIYLFGRNKGQIDNFNIATSYDKLPRGIDLGVLAIPAQAVFESIVALKNIEVKTIACLSSGFAELGNEGVLLQEKIGNYAFKNNIRMIGPNCIGYFNYVDNFHLGIVHMPKQTAFEKNGQKGIAIVTQSGGIGMFIGQSFGFRGVPTTYSITIGNQADIKLSDFVEFLIDDEHTSVIAIYAEEIKKPQKLLSIAQEAKKKNKNIVLLHTGKSQASRSITQSHTGSLTANYALMETKLINAGIAMVDSLEELIDFSQLCLRFPSSISGGVGLMTHSGAICAIVSDCFDKYDLKMPPLSSKIEQKLKANIPSYLPPRNPLDVGIEASKNPKLVGFGLECLADEPQIGSILCVMPIDQSIEIKLEYLKGFIQSMKKHPQKPAIYVALDDSFRFEKEFIELAKKEGVVLAKTVESAIKSLSNLKKMNFHKNKQEREIQNLKIPALCHLEKGNVAEFTCKKIISQFDIPIPKGKLAKDIKEALEIAKNIYPVVAKAQSANLAHKTDMGGVILNIKNDQELEKAFSAITDNFLSKNINLDGILVEKMQKKGLEMVIGARRDKHWGIVILVGIGGIWIEVLRDFCLLVPTLGKEAIINELNALKSAALLKGVRGSKGVDIQSVAKAVMCIGDLISSNERILEIEINPLIAKEKGVMALDALMVLD